MNRRSFYMGLLLVGAWLLGGCGNNAPQGGAPATTGAAEKKENLLPLASWLIGSWKGVSPQGISIENWERLNDTSFLGEGYFIKGKDTVSQESLKLVQIGSRLWYVPTVKEQNHGRPVPFKLTMAKPKELVFENPKHDFPQKITYTLHPGDTLVAVISGTVNNTEKFERFEMVRQR